MGSRDKRKKELDELAAEYGFVRAPGYTKNGHIKYIKGREIVFASATNSDRKALDNLRGEFKRRS